MNIVRSYTSGRNHAANIDKLRVVEGHDGLLVPAFINLHDTLPAFRRVHETARWISHLVMINAEPCDILRQSTRGIDFEPTQELGLAIAIADRTQAGIPNQVQLGRVRGGGIALRYERRSSYSDEKPGIHEVMTLEDEVIYDRNDFSTARLAAQTLQPFVETVLQDLGYGDPATFQQRATSVRQARQNS